jgi:pilus assembly protein Flp/PilA
VAQPLPFGHSSRGQAKERGRISNTRHRASEDAPENIMNFITGFMRNEEGQDLLEYALLIALIAIVSVVAVTSAGTKVKDVFTNIAAAIPAS